MALAPVTVLARVFRAGGRHPTTWSAMRSTGPLVTARFDPHPEPAGGPAMADSPAHATAYLGLTLQTCLAEAFQQHRVVDRSGSAPHLALWRPTRVVRLLDLSGSWPTRAGASQAVNSGPRDRSRQWARAIFSAYDDVEGLWYPSSMDGGQPAVCLWPLASDALPPTPLLHLSLDDAALELPLLRACTAIGYQLM